MFDGSAKAHSYQAGAIRHRVRVSASALAVAAVLTRTARTGC
jgi:hypothetical protein